MSQRKGRPPTFDEWNNSKSPVQTGELSFDLCHGNEGIAKTPERNNSKKCRSSPGVINTNRKSQVVYVPRRQISQFPPIDEKYNYIHPGCGGYKKIRRTRKKSKKSAKHIKKNLRKTKNNKKK